MKIEEEMNRKSQQFLIIVHKQNWIGSEIRILKNKSGKVITIVIVRQIVCWDINLITSFLFVGHRFFSV